jgi:hypothetical protein
VLAKASSLWRAFLGTSRFQPATERIRPTEAALSGRLPKPFCATGLTLAATSKTLVQIPDTLWHSGVGAAAPCPLHTLHPRSKRSSPRLPLHYSSRFSSQSYKKLSDSRFFGANFEKLKNFWPTDRTDLQLDHIAAPQLVHWSSSKERIPESIAEQRQEFEARLKEQAPKIREVNARFELKKLSIPTLATVNNLNVLLWRQPSWPTLV